MAGSSSVRSLCRGVVWGAVVALGGVSPGGIGSPLVAQPAGGTISPPAPGFRVVAFSADGGLKATSGPSVQIWRTSDGALLHTLRIREPVLSMAFSPDGRLLATGSPKSVEDAVRLWRVSDGKCIRSYRETGSIGFNGLAFSADGRRLIVKDSGWTKRLRVPASVRARASNVEPAPARKQER